MKLKTLKDIARYNGICYRGELKEEAIKWVKFNKRIIKIIVGYKKERIGCGGDFNYITTPITKDIFLDNNLKRFIKYVNNITEEDLK